MSKISMRTAVALALGSTLFWAEKASAEEQPDLSTLSIEQLAQIKVTSASKQAEPLSQAPAAIYVITNQEIEDSGAISLPEALRLAPNINVQQIDSSQYAIAARGFNGIQAGNKLLVLIDGRSIYTPLADNVLWNIHQPLLEDIQQVEVISGPGGTLYGPNAVNGVVNITTKDAQDTIGALIRGVAGPDERAAAIRYGFEVGSAGALRFYADYHGRDGLPSPTAVNVDDDFKGWQTGFRGDFGSATDHFTVQGDLFHATDDQFAGDRLNAHNILGRWTHALGPAASFQLQSYYDWYKTDVTLVENSLSTIDNEAQFNLTSGKHQFVAGAGVRTTKDLFINNLNAFELDPESRRLWVYNVFAQDRFSLTRELSVIAGVKLEKSTFVGWQFLPNLRLAYQPDERSLLWAAVSRAVRTPSRIDRELEFLPFVAPSTEFQAEKLTALEAGYRSEPTRWLSFSANLFYNFYTDLRTTEVTDFPGNPIELLNGRKGRTYGIEAWGKAQITPWWRLSLGGTMLHKRFDVVDERVDLIPRNSLGADPRWQVKASSDMDLAPKLKLTLNLRGVAPLDLPPHVPGFVEAGGKLGYDVTDRIELFVAGRNLLHHTHLENGDPAAQLVKRSVYAGAGVQF